MLAADMFYRRPPLARGALAVMEWVTVLLGWVATILIGAWIVASVENKPDLADWLIYGFFFACSASLGLRELRGKIRIVPLVFAPPDSR
jgi:hypothetical protein